MRLYLTLAILAAVACGRPAPPAFPTPASASVWTFDHMMTKPGQHDRYLRYVAANWARARQTLVQQGKIRSFNVLVRTATADAPWDVMLVTEYPDSASHANAEELFRPVLDAQGQTLIDGLSGRGPDNVLKKTVSGHVLRAHAAGLR